MMPTTYTISEHDYVCCAQINSEPRRTTQWINRGAKVALAIIGLITLLQGRTSLGWTFIGAAAAAVLLPWLLRRLIAPLILKRHYRTYKKIHEPMSVELIEAGLSFGNVNGHSTLIWHNIHAWRERSDYLLIYLAPNVFHSLPARISEDGFPLTELTAALT